MARRLVWREVIKRARPIKVFAVRPFESITFRTLMPTVSDAKYFNRRYNGRSSDGDGTSIRCPITYCAAPVSPHYAIVDLWFELRNRKERVIIEVNDWLLQVTHEGVIAENGQFTRLLPD